MNQTAKKKTNFKLWASLILSVLVIVVVLQNTEEVPTKILFFTVSLPRAVLLFVTFLAGFVVGRFALRKKKKQA